MYTAELLEDARRLMFWPAGADRR